MRVLRVLLLIVFASCAVDTPMALVEVSPGSGEAVLTRELGQYGELVAKVPVWGDFHADGVMTVSSGLQTVVLGPGEVGYLEFTESGAAPILFELHDGDILADIQLISVLVQAPKVNDCYEMLDLYQVDYEMGPGAQGVEEPVTVKLPLNGIAYRAYGADGVREELFMDCQLAANFARGAELLRRRDIFEVTDIGIYNYRCIGGGQPPGCTLSQHAYAKGIDLAAFTNSEGEVFSVLDDWVVDEQGVNACDPAQRGYQDQVLHDIICDMKEQGIIHIGLTPNYNEAHRNHFHVDLKSGGDFLEHRVPVIDEGDHGH